MEEKVNFTKNKPTVTKKKKGNKSTKKDPSKNKGTKKNKIAQMGDMD